MLTGLAAAYTHYYALVSVAFIYVTLFIVLLLRNRHHMKTCLLCCAATVAGYLPWLSYLLGAFQRSSSGWWSTTIPSIKDCIAYLFGNGRIGKGLFGIMAVSVCAYFVVTLIRICRIKTLSTPMAGDGSSRARDILEHSDMMWMLMGLITIAGTAFVGLAVSHLFRPLFLTRYLFPISGILWLILSATFTRVFRGRILSVLLLLTILILGMRGWYAAYQSGLKTDVGTTQTVAYMKEHLDGSDVMVTNISHLNKRVLKFYFAQTKPQLLADTDWSSMQGKRAWLFLSGEIDSEIADHIKDQNGSLEFIRTGNIARYSHTMYLATFP